MLQIIEHLLLPASVMDVGSNPKASRQSKIIAYASATVDFATWSMPDYFHLAYLFVADAYRSQRTEAQLFDAVAAHTHALGHETIQWQTPAWNAGAIRFYDAHGAVGSPKMRYNLQV